MFRNFLLFCLNSTPRPTSTTLPPKVSQPVVSGGYPSQPGGFSTTYLPPKTSAFPSSTPTGSPSAGYPSPSGFTTPYGYTTQRPGFSSTGTVVDSTYNSQSGYSSQAGYSSQGGYVSQPSPRPSFPTPGTTGIVGGSDGYTYSTPTSTAKPSISDTGKILLLIFFHFFHPLYFS